MSCMLYEEIPTIEVPTIKDFTIEDIDEPIVSIRDAGIMVQSKYYEQGIPGSAQDCYARQTVVMLLKKAEAMLPDGLRLKVYDAYRPISIQQRLWNFYRQKLRNENPELNDDELDFKTSFFVSKPSYDVKHPSLHNTGGAVDLTLVTDNGYELNMGTLFDDFTDRAWTNHFEVYESAPEIRNNRRILYNTMLLAGFTNLPSEWWHYGYGTKFWGYFKGCNALYKGVLDMDLPNRFPLM